MSSKTLSMACGSCKGLDREENQDNFHIDVDNATAIVADGLGGHLGGATASRIAVQFFLAALKRGDDLKECMRKAAMAAHAEVKRRASQDINLKGMGSTMVAMIFDVRLAYVVHIGDSRLYQLANGILHQLTVDQTVGQEIGADKASMFHNYLTSSVGGTIKNEIMLDPVPYNSLDRFLLCSDGVTNEIENDEIQEIMERADTPEEVVEEILRRLKGRASDDHTLVVVFVK